MIRKLILLSFLLFSSGITKSQDLLSLLDSEAKPEVERITNSFKSTRVLMSHSMEHVGGGVLDFRIMHRFGMFSDGRYEAWGFDKASMRIGLDYGLTNRLMIGIGRSTFRKEADAFVKYRLLWQTKGLKRMPVTVEYIAGMSVIGTKWDYPDRVNYFSSRLNYYHQVIIGRKFKERITLQAGPILIHRNLVDSTHDKSDLYAAEIGGRIKLTKRLALNFDYYYFRSGDLPVTATRPLSIGFDIETGGHVFQLHFTNAPGMTERAFVTETTGQWLKGNVEFGFNLSRVFTLDSKIKRIQKAP
ncbi:hypothetical protein LBMAG27_13970 [Bacteroidota bacterium]|nr:hypothetical protein LBMAG27_13970 [Bacteroidota bacterium]